MLNEVFKSCEKFVAADVKADVKHYRDIKALVAAVCYKFFIRSTCNVKRA